MISIREVLAGSAASELGLRPGDGLLAVDGEPLEDFLDWNFLSTEPSFSLEVLRRGEVPRRETLRVERDLDAEFGVLLEAPAIKRCTNKCDFCFIDQMPAGLRRSLYVKDEDYRYSFLYGNFVTLTNLRDGDYARIVRYRLTPLYVSVHATDPDVRERILKNPRARDLLAGLGRLADGGIAFHAQVVLCPGVNDGPVLLRTFADLLPFGEALLSISVVPVGLTNHRERLPAITSLDPPYARDLVERVLAFRKGLPTRDASKIHLSDELYLLGGAALPSAEAYGDFGLVENGVGMTRLFLEEFREAGSDLLEGEGRRVALLTGRMMAPFLTREAVPELERRGWRATVVAVENRLFGPSVTCAGLLAGGDLLAAARAHPAEVVLYPQDALNIEGRFLDDLSQEELAARVPAHVSASRFLIEELNEAARTPRRGRRRPGARSDPPVPISAG